LVFVTKYRRQVFDGDAIQRLKVMFEKVCSDFQAQLVEMNGEAEHVHLLHLLINHSPKHSVSSMVNSLKGVSSRLLRIERPDIEKRYWKDVRWSPSYFAASCGGAPLGSIQQYVEQQKTPPRSFCANFRFVGRFLRRHTGAAGRGEYQNYHHPAPSCSLERCPHSFSRGA
jgi:putative transposase